MRIGRAIFILMFQIASFVAWAQPDNGVWRVGDKLPDFRISNLINYTSKSVALSDFRGKLLILEFWNTSCIACMESWPKLVKLQAKFKDRIQVVLINTQQDRATIESVVERREKALKFKMNLPIACNDSVMGELFRPLYYPYIVWIEGEGVLKGMEYGSSSLSEEKIKEKLESEAATHISDAITFFRTADPTSPLFINGNAGQGEEIISQTVFARHIDGLYPSWNILPGDDFSASTITNSSILDMFRFLYGGENNRFGVMTRVPLNRIELIGGDTSRWLAHVDDRVRIENIYSYQCFRKGWVAREELKRQSVDEIERYFNVKSYWEKQTRRCLVFRMVDSERARYKEGPLKLLTTDVNFHMNKCTVSEMIQDMEGMSNYYYSPYPIVDDTGYEGPIGGIEIETDVYDHVALDKALRKFGIRFTLEERELDILVIRTRREQ